MPADGVLAAYKRDFGTSRCASRAKDYNSFPHPKGSRNVCFWCCGRLLHRHASATEVGVAKAPM